jgi:hypothetical protein
MHPSMTQSLVSDHIREIRQQAAAARRGGAARSAVRKASNRKARRGHWLVGGHDHGQADQRAGPAGTRLLR